MSDMKSSFAKLKSKTSIANLQAQVEAVNTSYSNELDNLIWKPTPDKAGNISAVIRFLPAPDDDNEVSPFVKLYNHGFQNSSGRWFIENCPTTLKNPCPVCSKNSEYYDSGIEANKLIASKQKRKLNYYANIIVLKDPQNPDTEYEKSGKVYVLRFGAKIFEHITVALKGEFDASFNAFDLLEGANFKLRGSNFGVKGKMPNYDGSSFADPSMLFDGDEDKLLEVWGKCNKLQPIVAPDKFKSYEEIEQKFLKHIGASSTSTPKQSKQDDFEEDVIAFENSKPKVTQASTPSYADDDDDELLSLLNSSDD